MNADLEKGPDQEEEDPEAEAMKEEDIEIRKR